MEYVIGILAVVLGVPMAVAALTRRPGQSFSERLSEVADAIGRGGDAMQRLGCFLTLAVTVPIVGLVLFGWVGLIVGVVIALLFAGGALANDAKGEKTDD